MKITLAILLVIATTYSALAQFNGCLPGLCSNIFGGGGTITPVSTGKILLVDAASFILQTDGTSKICLAGGC